MEETMLPDFETYHVDIITKSVWHWHKERNRSMLQGEKTRNLISRLCVSIKETKLWSGGSALCLVCFVADRALLHISGWPQS